MPTIFVTLWDHRGQETIMPLPYSRIGKKYVYGPEAAEVKRKRPTALKPSPWSKVRDGYSELFNLLRRG